MIPSLPKGFTHPMALGEGVFSSVIRARQVSLDRWVAIKILKEKSPARRAEQLKEARLQAAMQVSCVPEVIDAFEWRKQIFIIMQWVKGVRLSGLLEKPLTDEKKCWIAEAVIQAVANLHENGYVHCDLKPDNILLSPQDGAYLVDFGLSHHAKKGSQRVAESVKGTPAFMAPELWMGREKVDYFRADIFAVGKMLLGILGKDAVMGIVEDCLEEDPAARPPNGGVLLKRWYRQSNLEHSSPDWHGLAGNLASEQLARSLYKATENLLHVNRSEEAYWLLVECLEEDPNHAGALALMGEFPVIQKKSRRKKHFIFILAFGSIMLAVAAFYFGFTRGKKDQSDSMALFEGHEKPPLLIKTARRSPGTGRNFTLRPATTLNGGLLTRLKMAELPEDGRLTVDDKILNKEELINGCDVSSGPRLLAWESVSGDVLWTQEIILLPFQTMTIQLPRRLFLNQ